MRSLRAKRYLRFWILMAAIDVLLVSFTSPLSFYAGIVFSQESYSPKFWGIMIIQVVCNAISLILGYIISWLIYSKGEKPE
jgi:thiamine transporter ThiT